MDFRFFLLFMAFVSLGGFWEAPWFCHDYDCPVYTVVNTYGSFQERRYDASQWITTHIASTGLNDIQAGFWRLYYFVQRKNKDGNEMVMTRPVVVSVNEATENGGNQVSISFFISAGVVLPEPNDETIKKKVLAAATVYVREFGGIANEEDVKGNVQKLKEDLKVAGKQFDGTRFEAAGYDAPWVLVNRHNEGYMNLVTNENILLENSFLKSSMTKVKVFKNDRYGENEDTFVYIKSNLKCSFKEPFK